MPRLSTLSNPTELSDVDKKSIGIVLAESSASSSYSLHRLDLSAVSLSAQARVVVVARRGNGELRTEHGTIAEWNKGFIDTSELGTDGTWSFRVLFVAPSSPKLLAAVENVRPEGLGNSESLIALEPADLGQVPWEFVVLELEGRGVIRFNRDVYPTSAAAEADSTFASLVFPQAIRALAAWHTHNRGALAENHWEPFKSWLVMHGITEDIEDEEFSTVEGDEEWCKSVVEAFCARHRFADMLRGASKLGDEE